MAKLAGLHDSATFDFEGSSIAFCVTAFSIVMSALFGSSSVTVYIESATGISGTYNVFLMTVADILLLQRVGGRD